MQQDENPSLRTATCHRLFETSQNSDDEAMDAEQLLDEQLAKHQKVGSRRVCLVAVSMVLLIAALALALLASSVQGTIRQGTMSQSQSLYEFATCDAPKCDATRRRLDSIPLPSHGLRALTEWAEWSEWKALSGEWAEWGGWTEWKDTHPRPRPRPHPRPHPRPSPKIEAEVVITFTMVLQLADATLEKTVEMLAKDFQEVIALTLDAKISMVNAVVVMVNGKLEVKCEVGVASKSPEAPMLMLASVQAFSFAAQTRVMLAKEGLPVTGCEVEDVKAKEEGQKACKSGAAPGPFTFKWADGWESPALGNITAKGAGPLGWGEPKIGEAASKKALTFSNKDHTLELSWENKVSKLVIPYSDADFGETIRFSTNGKNAKITVKKTGPTDSWDDDKLKLSGSGNDLNSDPKDYTEVILEDEEGFTSVSMEHSHILPRGTNAVLDLQGKVMCAEPPEGPKISGEFEMTTKDLPSDRAALTVTISSSIAATLNIDAHFVVVDFKLIPGASLVKVSFKIMKPFMLQSTAKGLLADIKKPSFSHGCMASLIKQAKFFGIAFKVTALHVDSSSCKMVLPKLGYARSFVSPALPVAKPAGFGGFLLPVLPVISISVSISLSVSFAVTALVGFLRISFMAVFSLFGFSGSFGISLGSLLVGGRRLGESVSGSTQVDVDVKEPPAELQQAAESNNFGDEIKTAIENEKNLKGKVTASTPEISQSLDDEAKGPYTGKGWHTVCRQSAADISVDAMGSAVEESGTFSVRECSEKCNQMGEGCKGFEYRKSTARCEIHTKEICHSEDQNPDWFKSDNDFQCFIKCN
eukprot:TRINITY_DN3290_c0_g1_i1.p1 TRINITY_DN3290_c0_g1~~TRINITY_DN3290_c0_g1_i1.p1  ORF type:complete len:827 (+),score=175.91 TRINITY_DN3290_c0_g1_i1:47-2482(+)